MDNTVGSLTQYQKSLIIGTILGDGYLRTVKGRKNAFLEVNHSSKSKDYVDWKYEVLKNLVISKPKIRSGNKGRVAYRFFTRQHPFFTEVQNLYYCGNEKIIPQNINIDPVILAVWYMDDGSRCRNRDVYLNTQQFDLKSQYRLLNQLEKIGLKGSLNKDKQYYRIRFYKSSIPKLFQLIETHIIPSMRYKIEL